MSEIESSAAPATPVDDVDAAVADFEARIDDGVTPDIEQFCRERAAGIRDALRRELRVVARLRGLRDEDAGPPHQLGPYRIFEEIGRGGMGVVFRAHDENLRRDVALKLVAVDPLRPERGERFLREGRAMAKIRHPHVVEVHALGREGDWLYIAMATMERSLAPDVKRGPVRDEAAARQATRWIRQAAEAVAACHREGVLHRDLKPENLLVDRDGAVRVGDFGIAGLEDEPKLTRTGQLLGTPAYAPPEQLRGESADERTDVYGLGGCLFALWTGEAPGVMPNAKRERLIPSCVPRGERRAVIAALEDEAERRPNTVARWLAQLDGGTPRRRRTWAIPAVATVIAGGAALWWSQGDPTAAATGARGAPSIAGLDEGPDSGDGADSASSPRGSRVPTGHVVRFYQRSHAENDPPAEEERGPASHVVIPSGRWDRALEEFSRSRDPAAAIERHFVDAGREYNVRVERIEERVVLQLRRDDGLVAEATFGIEELGTTEGWGIYREITDEDGDGHREVVLVRVTDVDAAVAVVKWEPRTWGPGTGWTTTGTPADQAYAVAPGQQEGTLAVLRGGVTPGRPFAIRVETLAMSDGQRVADPIPLSDVVPVGPRRLGQDTAAMRWLTRRLRSRTPAAGGWSWPDATDDEGVESWVPVAGDPTIVAAVLGGPALRSGAVPNPVVARFEHPPPHGATAHGDAVVLTTDDSVVRLRRTDGASMWRRALPPGMTIAVRASIIGDVDGDSHSDIGLGATDGRVLVVSGVDGRTLWQRDGDEPVVAPLVRAAPRCLLVVRRRYLDCLTPDGTAARRVSALGRFGDRPGWVAPVRPGHVLVGEHERRDDHLVVLSLVDGRRDWSSATRAPVVEPPFVQRVGDDAWVFAADRAGNLLGLPMRGSQTPPSAPKP